MFEFYQKMLADGFLTSFEFFVFFWGPVMAVSTLIVGWLHKRRSIDGEMAGVAIFVLCFWPITIPAFLAAGVAFSLFKSPDWLSKAWVKVQLAYLRWRFKEHN